MHGERRNNTGTSEGQREVFDGNKGLNPRRLPRATPVGESGSLSGPGSRANPMGQTQEALVSDTAGPGVPGEDGHHWPSQESTVQRFPQAPAPRETPANGSMICPLLLTQEGKDGRTSISREPARVPGGWAWSQPNPDQAGDAEATGSLWGRGRAGKANNSRGVRSPGAAP